MYKSDKFKSIIVTFKTPNGNQWDETYTTRLFDVFIKDPTVYVIIDKETDEIIYRRKER